MPTTSATQYYTQYEIRGEQQITPFCVTTLSFTASARVSSNKYRLLIGDDHLDHHYGSERKVTR